MSLWGQNVYSKVYPTIIGVPLGTQIYIQTVFAVEDRINLIKDSWREELHKYITGIVQNKKHNLNETDSVSFKFASRY